MSAMIRVRQWYDHQLNTPETRYTRYLLGALLILFLLGRLFGSYAEHLFALIPGSVFSHYSIWTFVTAGLYDTSFTMGLINILVYLSVAPMLEREWGGYNFLKFIGVTNLCVMVSIFFSMIFCYAASAYEPCLYRSVCGFSGINAAFAVALKQKFGERSCVPGVKYIEAVKFKHLPMVLCWVSLILWLSGNLGGKESPLIFFGIFYSFVYLRFFMRDIQTGLVGDLRQEFALATFFPDILNIRPLVDFAGTVVFQTFIRIGFFQESVKTNQTLPTTISHMNQHQQQHHSIGMSQTNAMLAGANSSSSSSSLSSSGDLYRQVDPTAERRRLLAIKAIDDKLAELARQPSNLYPEMHSALEGGNTQFDTPIQPAATSSLASVSAVALPSEEEITRMEVALTGSAPKPQ